LLAIFAELAGSRLVLNELAEARAELLNQLFPDVSTTRHDAAHIHDHLDEALLPSVVLMNPPFSVAAHVDGVVADAALRHVASALARLADGGRLVAITGAGVSPDHPSWRDTFVRLQERGRVVFSAALEGRVYARHGPHQAPCPGTLEMTLDPVLAAAACLGPAAPPGALACRSSQSRSGGCARHPGPHQARTCATPHVERGDSVRARRHRAGL
jgi:hypothetical protein